MINSERNSADLGPLSGALLCLRRLSGRIALSFISIFVLILWSGESFAQQSTRTSTEPGQIEKRFERRPEQPTQSAPIPPRIEKAVPATRPPDTEEKIVLSAVNVTGATVYSAADFTPFYEEFLGRKITNREIEIILERISAKYTDQGYFLTSAIAPPQDLSFGIVSIQVVEGYIERVKYAGDRPGRPRLFDEWAKRITQSIPARLSEIERYILLIGENAGVQATPRVDEAPAGGGAFEMTISLAHDRFDLSSSIDNRGTNPVGPLQWSLSGGANSFLGGLERTRLSVFTVPDNPEELLYGQIYSQAPITAEGTHAWASMSRSKVDIYSASRGSDLQSTGDHIAVGFWHPFIRQQELALYLIGQFDISNSRQSATDDNFSDRLRVARGGFRLWFKDGIGGSTTTTVEYSRGLDILNASELGKSVSRSRGESAFHKYTLDSSRTQKLTADFSAEFNGRVQYSSHVLLSGEEFAIGGSRFGRGYDPSEISDSRGAAASIELRHRAPVKKGPLSKVWLYGFYDIGAVWREDSGRDSLASLGGGFRIFPLDGIRATLELALPLTYTVSEERYNRPRVFFAVSVDF